MFCAVLIDVKFSKERAFLRKNKKECVQVMFYYKIIEFLKDSMLQFVKSGVLRRKKVVVVKEDHDER